MMLDSKDQKRIKMLLGVFGNLDCDPLELLESIVELRISKRDVKLLKVHNENEMFESSLRRAKEDLTYERINAAGESLKYPTQVSSIGCFDDEAKRFIAQCDSNRAFNEGLFAKYAPDGDAVAKRAMTIFKEWKEEDAE